MNRHNARVGYWRSRHLNCDMEQTGSVEASDADGEMEVRRRVMSGWINFPRPDFPSARSASLLSSSPHSHPINEMPYFIQHYK